MEAALDEEAVEPPTIPEDAPAGTQGRLFDDAPPVVETTTEEAVEEGAPPVVDDEAKAAADIVSETVIEREGQPTEVITQTRAEFEAAVEEAQQNPNHA